MVVWLTLLEDGTVLITDRQTLFKDKRPIWIGACQFCFKLVNYMINITSLQELMERLQLKVNVSRKMELRDWPQE